MDELRRLHDVLAQAVEKRDENALIDVFSVKDGARNRSKPDSPIMRTTKPPEGLKPRPQLVSEERRKGGFVISQRLES
jgi:hypothetical protein